MPGQRRVVVVNGAAFRSRVGEPSRVRSLPDTGRCEEGPRSMAFACGAPLCSRPSRRARYDKFGRRQKAVHRSQRRGSHGSSPPKPAPAPPARSGSSWAFGLFAIRRPRRAPSFCPYVAGSSYPLDFALIFASPSTPPRDSAFGCSRPRAGRGTSAHEAWRLTCAAVVPAFRNSRVGRTASRLSQGRQELCPSSTPERAYDSPSSACRLRLLAVFRRTSSRGPYLRVSPFLALLATALEPLGAYGAVVWTVISLAALVGALLYWAFGIALPCSRARLSMTQSAVHRTVGPCYCSSRRRVRWHRLWCLRGGWSAIALAPLCLCRLLRYARSGHGRHGGFRARVRVHPLWAAIGFAGLASTPFAPSTRDEEATASYSHGSRSRAHLP